MIKHTALHQTTSGSGNPLYSISKTTSLPFWIVSFVGCFKIFAGVFGFNKVSVVSNTLSFSHSKISDLIDGNTSSWDTQVTSYKLILSPLFCSTERTDFSRGQAVHLTSPACVWFTPSTCRTDSPSIVSICKLFKMPSIILIFI